MTSPTKRRKTLRLPHYDYSTSGAFFVTTCVKNKKQLLAEIKNEKLHISTLGKIAEHAWLDLPNHYANINLDEFVIMPNHMHDIIWIVEPNNTVGEGLKPSPTKHGLSEILRAYKTFSARRINETKNTFGEPFWQRSYYEHIIRDDEDLYQHRQYIQNNPLKWGLDQYFQ